MTYTLQPRIVRFIPFKSEGGALGAAEIGFGPIHVNAKLYRNEKGYFLSFPSRHSEKYDKWYDLVTISDQSLIMQAQIAAVKEHERSLEENQQHLVAV